MFKILLAFKNQDEEDIYAKKMLSKIPKEQQQLTLLDHPIRRDTIIRKPKSELALEELEKIKVAFEFVKQQDSYIIKTGETIIPDYKAKYLDDDNNGSKPKIPREKKTVTYDLQETQKTDTTIAFKPGLISRQKKEQNNEEY